LAKDKAKRPARQRPLVIDVDGPAASGKGTIARALASHYRLPHMDTGLLYRAVALNLWRWGGDPSSEFEALRACAMLSIDPSDEELRSEPVSRIASSISAYPAVRTALLERQQEFAGQPGGAVLDGRDIGTVVAQDAPAKLFVTASPEVRARKVSRTTVGKRTAVSTSGGGPWQKIRIRSGFTIIPATPTSSSGSRRRWSTPPKVRWPWRRSPSPC
jgi:cytidylate kinase